MTCIVGLVSDGEVYLGCDSFGADQYSGMSRKDLKIFKNGDSLVGFTTSFRMGQLLQFQAKFPARRADQDLFEFMVVDYIEEARRCLKQGGFSKKINEVEEAGCFLVGLEGRLFVIESDYQVGEPLCGFDAIGCGRQLALGALAATRAQEDPVARVATALRAAAEFSTGVRGPFHLAVMQVNGKHRWCAP